MGLDPDALQNTTATAVSAAVGASEGQIEAMARNLAEGGLSQLYKILLKLTKQYVSEEEMIMVDGQHVPVDPRSWQDDMDVVVNVGLGRGQKQERLATLQQTLSTQMQIWQAYGPSNGLVSMTQIRNTLADIQRIGGVYNSERYYMPMDPQREQQLTQEAQRQAAAAAQQQGDPNAAFIQTEQMKTQAKMATDMAKIQSEDRQAAAEEKQQAV